MNLYIFTLFCATTQAIGDEYHNTAFPSQFSAIMNISYIEPATGARVTQALELGRYGVKSQLSDEFGVLVLVKSRLNTSTGCLPIVNAPAERWIALIQRGECKFDEKIRRAAHQSNASAVIIYNDGGVRELIHMDHQVSDTVSIFISKKNGIRLLRMLANNTRVFMEISVGRQRPFSMNPLNKTSVLFVSISFIVLMIISLAWLIFYYVQRFRYAHAKERLANRLMNAAKKAVTKMPIRTLKPDDDEVTNDQEQCAVCIEPYFASEVIRVLPCKHVFHKLCVDPWLIDQRSCPMCKLDILQAYGLQVRCRKRNDSAFDADIGNPAITGSDSSWMLSYLPSSDIEAVRHQVELHTESGHPAAARITVNTANDATVDVTAAEIAAASPNAGSEATSDAARTRFKFPMRGRSGRGHWSSANSRVTSPTDDALGVSRDSVRSCPDELQSLMTSSSQTAADDAGAAVAELRD